VQSLVKFLLCGMILAGSFWLTARFGGSGSTTIPAFRDEMTLALLAITGTFVCRVSILVLFGCGWLFSQVCNSAVG
jgi:putative peptidoglycan lipid II flippase